MNHKTLISSVLALTLGASSLAIAQPRDDRRDPPRAERQDDRRDNRRDDRRDDRRDPPPRMADNSRGAGPDHDFRRGGRLPAQYRNKQYVVDDWRGHRLTAPPRGYHWVQTGPDYVLVAITTGIIASILLNQ